MDRIPKMDSNVLATVLAMATANGLAMDVRWFLRQLGLDNHLLYVSFKLMKLFLLCKITL